MEQAWELFRRGQLDQERHVERLRKAVQENLHDLIARGEIIAGDWVKVPIKSLVLPQFEFEPDGQETTGTFQPDQGQQGQPGQGGRPKKGQIVGRKPAQGEGEDGQGGDGEGGEGEMEVYVNVESVAEELFADLELPWMRRKSPAEAVKEEWRHGDIRKKGPMSNLDLKRSIIENIRRNAAKGNPGFGDLVDEDLRFRTVDIRKVPEDRIAVLFIRDRSGSMGDFEKHYSRVMAFWITRFLQHKYRTAVETAYILHDTEADEVDEEAFYGLTDSGGTRISSGFELARQIIDKRFPPAQYNLYVFAMTDGDNLSSDNARLAEAIKGLLPDTNLIGLCEISADVGPSYYRAATIATLLKQNITHPGFLVARISASEGIQKAMQHFFRKRKGEGATA